MRPTPRCALLFAAGLPAALLPALVAERFWTVWGVWVGLCVLATGLDAILAPPRRGLAVTASASDTIFVGDAGALDIDLDGTAWRLPARVRVLPELHEDLVPQPVGIADLPARGTARVSVPLVPRRRGTVGVEAVWARWTGPLGLVARTTRHEVGVEVAVVPDIRGVRATALRFYGAREAAAGTKVERYLGDGSEFESLREYVPGLDPRSISWKASARHRMLLSREYRAERNHQVLLAVDTGHLMREPLDGIPKLDHAIHAALHLAYLGVRTGDRVGFFAFDDKVRCYAEPQGRLGCFRRNQVLTADLAYASGETNFTLGLADLSTRLKRRTLVVVLTDFVDVVTADLMIENLERLSRRHLVLFVALRDVAPEKVAWAPPRSLHDLHRAVVAGDFVRERDLVLRRLRRLGIHTIDAEPSAVSSRLLNRYLDAKRRELF